MAVREGFRLDPAVLPEGVVADASRHGVRAGAAGAAGIEPVEGRDAFVGARATGELAERAFHALVQFAAVVVGVDQQGAVRAARGRGFAPHVVEALGVDVVEGGAEEDGHGGVQEGAAVGDAAPGRGRAPEGVVRVRVRELVVERGDGLAPVPLREVEEREV